MKKNKDESCLEQDETVSRILDEKVMELHSLFELSQTLNSSLNVTTILDNLLLTPMGKMMISKGIVLLYQTGDSCEVATLKGLPKKLIGTKIKINYHFNGPTFIEDITTKDDEWLSFLTEHTIELLLPIKSSNKNLGIIGFSKKIINSQYLESELNFLNSLSNIAATAIENSLMVCQLQDVNRKLDKKVQELNTLFDIGKELNSTLDPDKILNLLSYAIMGEMMVNRCMIFSKNSDKLQLGILKGHRNEQDLEKFKQKNFIEAISTIEETIDLTGVTEISAELSLLVADKYQIIVPMQIQNETKGIIVIGEKILKADFTQNELEFLYTLGNEAMFCLENARLFEETLEKQRMEEELEIAREIQQGLLPKVCPNYDKFDISGVNISSQQVGGDYFDCIEIDDKSVCLTIADVSGKGIPASLLMANIQASLHATLETDKPLNELTAKINNIIHRNTGFDKFITYFCGILDIENYTFTSVNAGHNPPYFYHKDGSFELLEEGGLILGMMPNMPYDQQTVNLQPGDWIVMFTDGVSEAKNKADEDFEEYRIEKIIKDNLNVSAEEMKNIILDEVKKYSAGVPQSDDITMVILKVLES